MCAYRRRGDDGLSSRYGARYIGGPFPQTAMREVDHVLTLPMEILYRFESSWLSARAVTPEFV